MKGIVAENGKVVTDEMIAGWESALERDEWPSGWVNVGEIVEGKLPKAAPETVTLSLKVPAAMKRALEKEAKAEGTKAPETEPARCYTLMCTGDLGTAPVMVFRNEGDANDMMRALEQVAKVTSPDTVYDVMEAPFKEAI